VINNEMIDAFKGIYKDQQQSYLPMIHCHCFTRSSDPVNDIRQVRLKNKFKPLYNLQYIACN
jgi:hypothetical protein